MVDTLIETIAATKDIGEVQIGKVVAQLDDCMSLYRIEVDIKALMDQEGVAALAAGTYYIKTPKGVDDADEHTWDNFAIPDNFIYHEIIVDTHEAKAGSGTITPKLGSTSLTAINALGVTDDSAKKGTAKLAADDTISIVIASNTVTAGAFTIFIRGYRGN